MIDPVEQFLSNDFGGPAPLELQQAVFTQTARLLRRRRRARRLAGAAALAACFVAGMATMAWLLPRPEIVQQVQRQETQPPGPEQPAKTSALPSDEPPLSLADLEWRAFDSKDNRAALFFEVAERYLLENKDYESAVRCYRQALDASSRESLAIRSDDNWLVMALKESRQ
jgi:hypothetical protein